MYLEPLNTVYSYELKSRIIHRCVFLLQCDFEICANLILRNLPKELISMQQSQLPGHESPSSTFATPQTTATMPPPPSSSQSTSVPSSQTTSSLASLSFNCLFIQLNIRLCIDCMDFCTEDTQLGIGSSISNMSGN